MFTNLAQTEAHLCMVQNNLVVVVPPDRHVMVIYGHDSVDRAKEIPDEGSLTDRHGQFL